MHISLAPVLITAALAFNAGVVGRAVKSDAIVARDVGDQGIDRSVVLPFDITKNRRAVEPIVVEAPKVPVVDVPNVPGDTGNSGNPAIPGQPKDPGSPATPGQPKDPGNPAIPGQPKDPGNPAIPGQPKEPQNPQADHNAPAACKRGLRGRSDCSDEMMQELSSEQEFESSSDEETPYNRDMMRVETDEEYFRRGAEALKFQSGEETRPHVNWPRWTNKYEDRIPADQKFKSPTEHQSLNQEMDTVKYFGQLNLNGDNPHEWVRSNLYSKTQHNDPLLRGPVNKAYYSRAQKAIVIEDIRKLPDANERNDQIPASELTRQVWADIAGPDAKNLEKILQPHVVGKGSKLKIRDALDSVGQAEFTFDLVPEEHLSAADKNKMRRNFQLLSGIDNVRGFESMLGANRAPDKLNGLKVVKIKAWAHGERLHDDAAIALILGR